MEGALADMTGAGGISSTLKEETTDLLVEGLEQPITQQRQFSSVQFGPLTIRVRRGLGVGGGHGGRLSKDPLPGFSCRTPS